MGAIRRLVIFVCAGAVSMAALSACTGSPGGPTVAVLAPVHDVGPGAVAADAMIVTKRLHALGQSSDNASVRGTEVIVTGAPLKIPAADLAKTGLFSVRPVLCGAPPYSPPPGRESPPSGPLPSCGQYATTAANLAVNVNSGGPADDIPADPDFGPLRSTHSDNPQTTVLLPDDPAAGPQQYPRYVLAKASIGATAIASASALFDTPINAWEVTYTLTPGGARAWDRVARANFHQYVAFDLDGTVESAPLIQPDQYAFVSFGGKGEISGSFTATSARTLAAVLASGPLDAPLEVRGHH